MLQLQEVHANVRSTYWIVGPRGAVTFQAAQVPIELGLKMRGDFTELTAEICPEDIPPPPIQVHNDEAWIVIDAAVHHVDPDGLECELVPGGKCSLSSSSLLMGNVLHVWLASGKDSERLQVRLNEIYESATSR